MDLVIVDVALISFIVLVVGQIMMPERRTAATATEAAVPAS